MRGNSTRILTIEVPIGGNFKPITSSEVQVVVFAQAGATQPVVDRLQTLREDGLLGPLDFAPARITKGGVK